MTITDYAPSEIEIKSIGIGLIDSQYLDLTSREYLVVGDMYSNIETGLNIGEQHSYYWSDTCNMLPQNILYKMIVNNNGIGINTTRNQFNKNFLNNSLNGIYIENGDIFCDGTISARNIRIINEDGMPYVFNDYILNNSENIVNNLITAINSNITLANFYQGWNKSYLYNEKLINKNNIFTNSFINIGAGDVDTIDNLHAINVVSPAQTNTIENIQLAIKNRTLSQPITYRNSAGEQVLVKEPAGLRMGIIGMNNESPAIISTTYGMPLEFHIGKSSFDINKLYQNNDDTTIKKDIPEYDNLESYPAMSITSNGNVLIGNVNNNEEFNTKFQVTGSSLFDKIYKNDEISGETLELDDIYLRKIGNIFKASNIEAGNFGDGDYKFICNLNIGKNLNVDGNFNVNNLETDQINTYNINTKIITTNTSDEISQFNNPSIFTSSVNYSGNVNVSGTLFYNNYRLNALSVEKIENIITDENGNIIPQFADLTQDDLTQPNNIILYYGFNSNNNIYPSGSNLAVGGRLGIGITETDDYNNHKLIVKNDNNADFEILIEDSEKLKEDTDTTINKTYIGHINYSSLNDDRSLIFNTNSNPNEKRNIYFYAGIEKIDVINNDISPALSIYENNKIGINVAIDNIIEHTLQINGTLLVNDIYVNNNGNVGKIYSFLENTIANTNYLLINNNNINSKYFFNYKNSDINQNIVFRSKGLNIQGGINSKSDSIDSLNGGYFENNVKLASFKYINANDFSLKNHPKTSYINTNIIIGIQDLSDEGKESLVKNTDTSKPLVIRNISEKDYNDTIIRLYRGIINRTENLNEYNSSKYTGIDFCEWVPSTGNRDKDRWYIYRNHDNLVQTIDNYPGIFEIGYSDNEFHTNKSGLEIFYRRNNNSIVSSSQPPNPDDPQNYFFVFNRPKTEIIDHDYINNIKNKKTVEIYGDLDVKGRIFINGVELDNIGEHSHSIGDTIVPGTTTNIYNDPSEITDDIEITGKNIGIFQKIRTVIGDYDINSVDIMNNVNEDQNNNVIFYTADNKCVSSFISTYEKHTAEKQNINRVKFDLKLCNFYKDNNDDDTERFKTFDTNVINFVLSATNNDQDLINDQDFNYESLFSIENKNKRMISFYNNTENIYVNIGNHNNYDYLNKLNNICLHIEDNSEYLLQLTNNELAKNSKIVFHNKSETNKNHFWTIDAPNFNTNNFNIKYTFNNNVNDLDANYNNLNTSTNLTLTNDNKIGINNSTPVSTVDINSSNNNILNLRNYYLQDNNLELDTSKYNVINVNNSDFDYNVSFDNKNNFSIIDFNYIITLSPDKIPNKTIDGKDIYEQFKQTNGYIKITNKSNTFNNKLNIVIYKTNLTFTFEDYTDIELDKFWKFDTNIYLNENNTLVINNNIVLPSLENFSHTKYSDKWNFQFSEDLHNNFNTQSYNSNFEITYDDSLNTKISFIVNNHYKYIDSSKLNIQYDLVNIGKNYDLHYNKYNLHCTFENKIFNEGNASTSTYYKTYVNENYNNELKINIHTSNELYIDYNIKNSNYNIDVLYEIDNDFNFNLSGPSTLVNNNPINTNLISYSYNYDTLTNIYNFETTNILNSTPVGINVDEIYISQEPPITNDILYSYNNTNQSVNLLGNNIDISSIIDDDIKIIINNKYDKYIGNQDITHYIITNVVKDKAHIIFENEILGKPSIINNEIYSTFDGNLIIKSYDTENKQNNDLIEFKNDNRINAENSTLYIKNITVDNIFDRASGNSIINLLEKKELRETHTTDNFIMKTINQDFITSNKLIHLTNPQRTLYGAASTDVLKIKKTADYNSLYVNGDIIYNDVLKITANNSFDSIEKNMLSLSLLNSTSIANFGSSNNPAKIGIGMDKEDIDYHLDVKGDLRLTTNNISELQNPHIALNSHRNNALLDYYEDNKYNHNLIYSTNGEFKITAYNDLNSKTKDLIKLNNGKVEFDELETTKIIANEIYDKFGNSYFPDFHNLNNSEFLYNISNLHIISSNVQFTTSNINIALEDIKNNYFSINKVRSIELDTVLNNNISSENFEDIHYNDDYNYEYSSIVQKARNQFYSSSLTHHTINLLTDSSDTIIAGISENPGATDGKLDSTDSEVEDPLFNYITSIIYSDNYIYIADQGNNEIRFLTLNSDLDSDYQNIVRTFKFQTDKIEKPTSLVKYDNTLYVSNDKYIYVIDIENIEDTYENLTYSLIAGSDEFGYKDSSLLNSKFKNINTMCYDNSKNILYISDDNYSIRKVDLNNRIVKTIAGYLPNNVDDLSFSGSTVGDGIDARFNNVKKLIKVPDEEYLIILDNDSNNSRILAYDIENSFVSLIYNHIGEVSDLLLDIEDNKILYLITRSSYFIKIRIQNDYSNYNKTNITFHESDTNIFRITSIPHDSINYPYYTLETDYNPEQLVDSMTVKTNYKNTFVKFGSDDTYKRAFIGISKEPVYGIELDVNGLINTTDLNVNNLITALNVKTNKVNVKYLENYDSDNRKIITNSSIITGKSDLSLGELNNYNERFENIYIRNNFDIERYRLSVDSTDNYIKFTNTLDNNFIKTKQSGIILHNNTDSSRSEIKYINNKLNVTNYNSGGGLLFRNEDFSGTITTSNIDIENTLHSFEGIISNLTVYEDTHLNSNVYIYNALNVNSNIIANNDIICNGVSYFNDDIIVQNRISTNDLYVSSNILVDDSINLNGLLTTQDIHTDDIYIDNDAVVNNDLEIMQKLFTSNEVYFYSNLNVQNNLIVKDTLTTCNLEIIGNLTYVETTQYQTENLHIINDQGDGPSLKITHKKKDYTSDDNNIVVINNIEDSDSNNKNIIINDSCYLGIHKNPTVQLDISGDIKFTGSINNVSKEALDYIELLDEPILDKFEDTSNYIGRVDNSSSNFTHQVYDYLKYVSNLDVLNDWHHPIVKEFDNDGNLINNYNIKTVNNNIYVNSTINSDEYYIILKNDTVFSQKHYQLSLVNNTLADVLLVGGGGLGINSIYNDIYLNNRYKTISTLKTINFNNYYLFDISEDHIYYYNNDNNDNKSIYKCSLNDLTDETPLFSVISFDLANSIMKVSKNNELLILNKENSILINNLHKSTKIEIGNDTSGNNDGIFEDARFNKIKDFAINSKNNIIYVVENKNIRKIDLKNEKVSTVITFVNDISYIDITNDDNFLYISQINSSNTIIKLNLKNLEVITIIDNIELEINYLSLDKINNKYLLYNDQYNIYSYDLTNNTSMQITKFDDNIIYKYFNFTYDNNSIIFIKDKLYIYYYNFNYENTLPLNLPAPGGAGSLLFRKDLILNKGIYDLYVANNLSSSYEIDYYPNNYSLNDNFDSQLLLWLDVNNDLNKANLSTNTSKLNSSITISDDQIYNDSESDLNYYKFLNSLIIKFTQNKPENNLNYFIVFKNTNIDNTFGSTNIFNIKLEDITIRTEKISTREFSFNTNGSGKLTNYQYNTTKHTIQHSINEINILNIQISENSSETTKFYMNNVIFYDDNNNNNTPNQYTEDYSSRLTITQKETNNIEIYEIIIINRNLDENERDSLYNNLYYKYNEIQMPKIIKTINENGYNTNGFGVIVNGGTSAKENYNNINLPGSYKGYEVSNDYVLINDQYNNKEIVSDITNGGTGYSGLNYENNIYNGQKGFISDSIINQDKLSNLSDLSDLPTKYSYGAPSYDINENKYGKNGNGTDISVNINLLDYNYNKNEFISENYSGSGSVGGINNIFSKYPIINNSINKNILRLSTTSELYDNNIYQTIIKIDIASEFNIIMIDSNTTTGKYINATINLNPGNYKIIINNNTNHIKFCNNNGETLLVDSKELDTEYTTGWLNTNSTILENNHISIYDKFFSKLIKLTFIENKLEEDLTFDDSDNNFYYNFDETKSGSGIIILKYNIKKDVVNTIEDKFDKRLKLLEEALLFSRINTYSDNKESIMFFKNDDITKYYNNMFIDQSYTGIFVDLTDKNKYNTVEENFIFKWSIKYNLEDNYRDYVPNTNSKNINFITNTHLIKFIDYLHIPKNKYLYIDNINLEINDTIYNYNNNAYVSKIEYKNINITPIKSDIFPINNFKYKSDDLLAQTEIRIDNNLIKWSSYNESYNNESDNFYPLNVFNHNIKYGEWGINNYNDSDGSYIGSTSIYKIDEEFKNGEWILIDFDKEITLTSIDLILEDNIQLIEWYLGGRNDTTSTSTNFHNIIYYNTKGYVSESGNISINNANTYTSFILIVSKINEGNTQLKIKNIKLYGNYKDWDI
jgi:hypothetical protein